LADLAARPGVIGVVAHQRGHVERGRETGLPLLEQILEAKVGILRPSEAGKHPHRPEPAPIHRRIDAAGEWIIARTSELLVDRPPAEALRRVQRLDRETR